ncbi:hypothetical protein CL654_01095 [bacterium]|nr:hypothetical protein [bacterium]|tara:strand:+ start:7468 stop:7881 length:414 start_codon:yes stop_codon:yes gene_type:complete
METLKLYRGIKSSEFTHKDKEVEEKFNEGWLEILRRRAQGDLSYPEDLNSIVTKMFKIQPFTRQYFTDREEIAKSYAKKEHGSLITLEIPLKEILKYFVIEFQNYPKRKQQFDVVYIIKGTDLFKKSKDWNISIQNF